jgi:predicted dehydrogenase
MTMNVAVCGLGWWGKQIVNSLGKTDKVKVVAAFDPAPPADAVALAKEKGFKIEGTYEAVLANKDIGGVILTTPNAFHEQQTVDGFAAGKAVFCEKPLTMTGAGAARMVAAAEKAGKILGIGHERRYEPAFEELFKIVNDGRIGRLLSMEANVSHNQFQALPNTNWRKDPKMSPAGLYTGTGIHMTDIFCALGGTPVEVRAETDTLVFDKPMEDYARVKVLFKSGVHAMFSCLSCTPFYGRFTAFGEKGWVEIISEANVDWNRPTHLIVSTAPAERTMTSSTFKAEDTVTANVVAWAEANQGRGTYRFTPAHLVDNTKVFEALVQSAAKGGAVVKL